MTLEDKWQIDRQVIESTTNLCHSCLSKEEWEQVYNLLVKNRETFSLRDDIGIVKILK